MEKKQLVYILDDDPLFSFALEIWLERQGKYIAMVFTNSKDFFDAFEGLRPDIIILDFVLGEEKTGVHNGGEVAKKIMEFDEKIPMHMLSGQKELQVAVDLFSCGIVDYIVKDDAFHTHLTCALLRLEQMQKLKTEIAKLKVQSNTQIRRLAIVAAVTLLFWIIVGVV